MISSETNARSVFVNHREKGVLPPPPLPVVVYAQRASYGILNFDEGGGGRTHAIKGKSFSDGMFLYRGFSLLQIEHPLFLQFPGLFFKIFVL